MKGWFTQLAGTVLVLLVAGAVGGFVLVLRAQQGGLAATMAEAHIRAVSPADAAINVPTDGVIQADYLSRPTTDPSIKLEPPVGVTLDGAHWDGTAFVIQYHGLRDNTLYHVELDQDSWQGKGEHKQIKVRWSFRTGSAHVTPTPSTRPTATSTTSPTISPTPTPASTTPDLLWYSGSSTPGTNADNGVDWNGKLVKSVRWVGTTQAPNGHLIYNSITPSTQVFDTDGNVVGSNASASSAWADNSQEFCALAGPPYSAPYSLELDTLDGQRHPVGTFSVPPAQTSPPPTPFVVACSPLSGRAIVISQNNGYVWSVSMLSLTDGSLLYQRRYPNPQRRLVASHDGRYIAEQMLGPAAAVTTVIRELPSGNVVGQLSGIFVQGFSWDGSLVAGGIQGNNGLLADAEVINWQSRSVVWYQCACPSLSNVHVIAQPGGTKIAVAATNNQGLGALTIIDANGTYLSVPTGNKPFYPLF